MNAITAHLLSWVIFSPLLGLIPLFFIPATREKVIKASVFFVSLIPLVLSFILFAKFRGTGDFEFLEVIPWLQGYRVYYRLGIDGFSLPLIVLTTALTPLVVLASWSDVKKNVRGYLFFFLLLETGILGVFAAIDLFLFYVFWEAMLVPMYFLIGAWGGERRLYAAMKFVLYTMVGSLLMLAAILYLYQAGTGSFNLQDLYEVSLPVKVQLWLFAAFALAFAIKVPLFPFHTWLPDAHVQAPTGGSVILAGVLLKMGTYGFVRFAMPLFPEALKVFAPALFILSVIGIIYGALVAMVQPDLKKMVAYTSVSHMGFVILGLVSLTPQGISGATIQMVNHGISTGALFFLVGMIYERRHTREIKDFGGLASTTPFYCVVFLIITFSSIGLPGTNGFIGEFLILLGSYKTTPLYTSLATTGVVFGAVAMLWMVKRVFFGPITHEENRSLTDLTGREILILLPLVAAVFGIGFYPSVLLKKINPSTMKLVDRMTVERIPFGTNAHH